MDYRIHDNNNMIMIISIVIINQQCSSDEGNDLGKQYIS